MAKISCIYPPQVPNYVRHAKLFNFPILNYSYSFTFIFLHLCIFIIIYIHLALSTLIYVHFLSSSLIYVHLTSTTFIYLYLRSFSFILHLHLPSSMFMRGPGTLQKKKKTNTASPNHTRNHGTANNFISPNTTASKTQTSHTVRFEITATPEIDLID